MDAETLERLNKAFEDIGDGVEKLANIHIPSESELLGVASNLIEYAEAIISEISKWKAEPYALVKHGYLDEKVHSMCEGFNTLIWDYNLTVPKDQRLKIRNCDTFEQGDIDAPEDPEHLNAQVRILTQCIMYDRGTHKLKEDEACKSL